MLCSANLHHTLSPANASLESREAACNVTIRLFASLSCVVLGGREWWAAAAMPSAAIKIRVGEEMQGVTVCFANLWPLTANSAGAAGDFAVLTQPAVHRIMGPSWRHRPPVGPLVTVIRDSPGKKMSPSSPRSSHPTPGNACLRPLQTS